MIIIIIIIIIIRQIIIIRVLIDSFFPADFGSSSFLEVGKKLMHLSGTPSYMVSFLALIIELIELMRLIDNDMSACYNVVIELIELM